MRTPDDFGVRDSKAWKVSHESADKPHATLGSWIVFQPGVHPVWSYWLISLVHLRDVPGVPTANKLYPDAEYEIVSHSMNPEEPIADPDDVKTFKLLSPVDQVHQFNFGFDTIEKGDVEAIKMFDAMVKYVLDGLSSFDSDYQRANSRVIANTVEHAVLGGHCQGSA